MNIDKMQDVHLAGIDLNLLVVLDALLTERNVTRAAKRVGLSQSATSHALSRLRALFDDPLLVRGLGAMVPTPRAEALHAPVRDALSQLATAIGHSPRFDPKVSRRPFTVATVDYGAFVLAPRLLDLVSREAPHVDVRLTHSSGQKGWDRGDFDVALAPTSGGADPPNVRRQVMFEERFVCVLRAGHRFARGKLTLDRFCSAGHVKVTPGGTEAGGPVDDALAAAGRSRRVVMTVPQFVVAPHLVARTDYLLVLPRRVAIRLAPKYGLVMREPPLPVLGFSFAMFWHARLDADPGAAWFRDLLLRAAGSSRGR